MRQVANRLVRLLEQPGRLLAKPQQRRASLLVVGEVGGGEWTRGDEGAGGGWLGR